MPATRSDLVPLLGLQRVDEALSRIATQLSALPEDAAVRDATAVRDEFVPIHDERVAELARLGLDQQRLESEIATLRTKLERDRGRLAGGTVTSPREIVNLQAEIDGLTRRVARLEDDELEVMEQSEAVSVTLAEVRAQLDTANALLAAAIAARDAAAGSLTAEQARLSAERAAIVPGVEPDVLARYDKMRASLGGVVVAAFERGICGGCGLPLSPLAREDYRSSGEVWFACENCRRVLIEV
jgi:predicted  nucleic acid-binding Zn-ribbon protein